MGNIIMATYKKNRISIKRALPWSFIFSRIVGGISTIIFPYFIYYFFLNGNLTSEFKQYANGADYMTYIVLGSALNVLAVSTLMNVGRALITELREGTLEPFLMSPASRMGYFLGCLFEQTSRAFIEFAVVLLAGGLLGANLQALFSFDALFTILLAIFSFFCMGLLLSSVMMQTRDTYVTQNTLFNIMTLSCGIAFPIQYLPVSLQKISLIFPLTPAVNLFRAVVIGRQSIFSNIGSVVHIIILCIIYAAIGIIWFQKIERTLMEKIFG